jgi:hypothetical protein
MQSLSAALVDEKNKLHGARPFSSGKEIESQSFCIILPLEVSNNFGALQDMQFN